MKVNYKILKVPYSTPFWDLMWGIALPKMIYQGFKVVKTAAVCISMSSLLPLSGAADRTGCFLLPLEPLLWLADCHLSGTWPGLSPDSFWSIWRPLAVNTAESHIMFGYICRRPATCWQSVTTGCFWTVCYTVDQCRSIVPSYSTEFHNGVSIWSNVDFTPYWAEQHGTSEEIKRNRWSNSNVLRRHGHVVFPASLHAAVCL